MHNIEKWPNILWKFYSITAWKASKYGVFSGPYFPAFRLNTEIYEVNEGKCGPEKTPYLDTFAVCELANKVILSMSRWGLLDLLLYSMMQERSGFQKNISWVETS